MAKVSQHSLFYQKKKLLKVETLRALEEILKQLRTEFLASYSFLKGILNQNLIIVAIIRKI